MTATYITTTIPYVNARPHIGHALELVQADVLARYHRGRGDTVRFQAGTDDNALKNVLAAGGRLLGKIFWKAGDTAIIDGVVVDGSAKTIGFVAGVVRRVQSGFLYSYAFWMVIGLAVMLGWFLTH